MAKKTQEPVKPIFPLKHDFYASLDNYIHQAGMLADTVKQLVSMSERQPDLLKPEVKKLLQERLDAFEKARHGDE